MMVRFTSAIIFVALTLPNAIAEVLPDRPNVIVILTDDQGWGDLSANGNTNLETPNIDSLARDGARFENFFVSPVCSPTRAEFLTGRYHPRCGVYSTSAGGERIDLDEVLIAQLFQDAGYATGAFGKWHNGTQPPYHPNARGFDEFYGFCSGHWGNYFSPMLEHNGKIVQGDGFIVDDVTNHAIEFIKSNRDKPFFAYVPYNTPHSPMQVPDRWWNKFKSKQLDLHHTNQKREDLEHIRCALAMCENIDWNVGRILQVLDELELKENTIVVFFCDNGPNGFRWNDGLKGIKGSTDEGGIKSPLLVRWPNKIRAGNKILENCAAIDLLPTITRLAGIDFEETNKLDGDDLGSWLLGEGIWQEGPKRQLFSHWNGRVSVRSTQFRLDHQGRLFDMIADPGQRTDVAAENPGIVHRLGSAAERWREEVLAELQPAQRPFTVGHPDFDFTQLPARDAKASGDIQRSNRFPNCSYYTNWTNTDDEITWDVEVLESGQYEVQIYYACNQKNIGSTIELQFQDAMVTGKVDRSSDGETIGANDDRVPRKESYVKNWTSTALGKIKLEKGRGQLTMRAVDIPSTDVMEFRLLNLVRVDD